MNVEYDGGWWDIDIMEVGASLPAKGDDVSDDALRKGLNPYEWHRLPRS